MKIKVMFLSIFFSLVMMSSSFTIAQAAKNYQKYYGNDITIERQEGRKRFLVVDHYFKQSFYLKVVDDYRYVAAAAGLNIRRAPSINSDPIDTIEYGSEIKVIGDLYEKESDSNNKWVLIRYNNDWAFVWSDYLIKYDKLINPSISDIDILFEKNKIF